MTKVLAPKYARFVVRVTDTEHRAQSTEHGAASFAYLAAQLQLRLPRVRLVARLLGRQAVVNELPSLEHVRA